SIPTSTTVLAGGGECASGQVAAAFNVQAPISGQSPTQTRVLVTLTDVSSAPCTVYGYAGIGVGTISSATSVTVNRIQLPGPPVLVSLKPQQTAFAGLAVTSGGACPAVTDFALTPPNQTTPVAVKVILPGTGAAGPMSFCANAGVALGPFEPTSQGVVAFPNGTANATATCVAADLRGSFADIPGSNGAGNVVARIVLTNTSAAPCATGGYVGLQLLGTGGTKLPTKVVRQSGSVVTITLAPGASASASARYSPDVPGRGDSQTGPSCQPVAASSEIIPPGGTAFLTVAGPNTPVCESGTLALTPLQAGTTAGAP
ncbi:MAG: DUF4232 domain-containing protein, partial [Acidimicrobiales bacterium]